MYIRIHEILTGSSVNGPGVRNVVWFQGCTLNCPGCFNRLTHDPNGGRLISTDDLCEVLLSPEFPCDGITVSGGEPFQQPEGLLSLLKNLRARNTPPVLVFSGYIYTQLLDEPVRNTCLPFIDALICGPYDRNSPSAYDRFCSSSNQELYLLSDRLKKEDFSGLPLSEVIIDDRGKAIVSGLMQLRSK